MRQLLPGIVLYDEAGFRFIDRPGRREAAGDFIAASVVNNKPQINSDDFSILQFIGSNLAFAATALHRTKMLHSRSFLRGRLAPRPLFYHPS
jgi:hypothetical protein